MGATEWCLIAEIVALFIATFMVITFINKYQANKKKQMQAFIDESRDTLNKAISSLFEQMHDYTENGVIDEVRESYKKLIGEDLLPTVKNIGKTVDNFAQTVAQQQQDGIDDIAVKVTRIFTNKFNESMQTNFEALNELSATTKAYNQDLKKITESSKSLSKIYEVIGSNTNEISTQVNESVHKLEKAMSSLNNSVEAASICVDRIGQGSSSSIKSMESMVNVAASIEKTATDFASTITSQNAETVILLNDAVKSLGASAEVTAKEVFKGMNDMLDVTNEKLEATVLKLTDVSDNVHQSATEFAFAISNTYVNFSGSIEDRLDDLAKTVAQSANEEYKRILSAAGDYSQVFAGDINGLKETLDMYISDMRSISEHIQVSSDAFKENASDTSDMFMKNINETISGIFREFDTSLATISDCLIKSTDRIKEAADALPIAISSIKGIEE